MKTADGRITVETANDNTAKEINRNWPENLFEGSQCRETKAKRPLSLILKGVSLPEDNNTPLKLLKITIGNEEQVECALKSGVHR